jgi:hypothetical protein
VIFPVFLILVAIELAQPVAPWWVAPIEHVITAFLTGAVPSAFVVWWAQRSHKEHVETRNLAAQSVAEGVAGRESLSAQVEQVHQEVKTGNALKLGQLADATETRRIEDIEPSDRTEGERDHMRTVPLKE